MPSGPGGSRDRFHSCTSRTIRIFHECEVRVEIPLFGRLYGTRDLPSDAEKWPLVTDA